MKITVIALVVLLIVCFLWFHFHAGRSGKSYEIANRPLVPRSCDASLWAHVYHSKRLRVVNDCVVVTGKIEKRWREKDGDYHIRLRVDSQFERLLNGRNLAAQHGALVVEAVCQGRVTQPDAVDSCRGFGKRWEIPADGSHVRVAGPYVLDLDHGWMEIHPMSSIEVE